MATYNCPLVFYVREEKCGGKPPSNLMYGHSDSTLSVLSSFEKMHILVLIAFL